MSFGVAVGIKTFVDDMDEFVAGRDIGSRYGRTVDHDRVSNSERERVAIDGGRRQQSVTFAAGTSPSRTWYRRISASAALPSGLSRLASPMPASEKPDRLVQRP